MNYRGNLIISKKEGKKRKSNGGTDVGYQYAKTTFSLYDYDVDES